MRSEPLELELEELFDDEFELELLEEFELEFDEVFDEEFDDELELELLEELELEFDELLPATMNSPSVRFVCVGGTDGFSASGSVSGCSLASAAKPANAPRPAMSAVLSFQCFVMPFTPLEMRTGSSGPAE